MRNRYTIRTSDYGYVIMDSVNDRACGVLYTDTTPTEEHRLYRKLAEQVRDELNAAHKIAEVQGT